MISRTLLIKNKLGLHARAASVFVKTAGAFGSDIRVTRGEKQADGKSIMAMMMLQASCGTEIMVSTDGEDEAEAMTAIVEMIDNRFGEDE